MQYARQQEGFEFIGNYYHSVDVVKNRYLMYSKFMTATSKKIGCIDSATDILGNKWTPKLLRFFLNEETVRFCQIQELVGGINPRTLCSRLEELEREGIISKESTGEGSRCVYKLTEKGKEIMPILRSMQAWSTKYPTLSHAKR